MEITLAQPTEFAAIAELQRRFQLLATATDLAEGFVTTELAAADLVRLSEARAMWVAHLDAQVAAYACAVEWDFWAGGRFFDAVAELLPLGAVTWDNSFLYGPTCIDAPFRGRGILPALVEHVKARYAPTREFGVCFVDARNLRSLAAHERKLGFARRAQLPFDDVIYHVLTFQTA